MAYEMNKAEQAYDTLVSKAEHKLTTTKMTKSLVVKELLDDILNSSAILETEVPNQLLTTDVSRTFAFTAGNEVLTESYRDYTTTNNSISRVFLLKTSKVTFHILTLVPTTSKNSVAVGKNYDIYETIYDFTKRLVPDDFPAVVNKDLRALKFSESNLAKAIPVMGTTKLTQLILGGTITPDQAYQSLLSKAIHGLRDGIEYTLRHNFNQRYPAVYSWAWLNKGECEEVLKAKSEYQTDDFEEYRRAYESRLDNYIKQVKQANEQRFMDSFGVSLVKVSTDPNLGDDVEHLANLYTYAYNIVGCIGDEYTPKLSRGLSRLAICNIAEALLSASVSVNNISKILRALGFDNWIKKYEDAIAKNKSWDWEGCPIHLTKSLKKTLHLSTKQLKFLLTSLDLELSTSSSNNALYTLRYLLEGHTSVTLPIDQKYAIYSTKDLLANLKYDLLVDGSEEHTLKENEFKIDIKKALAYLLTLQPLLKNLDEQYGVSRWRNILLREFSLLSDNYVEDSSKKDGKLLPHDILGKGTLAFSLLFLMDVPTLLEYLNYQLEARQGIKYNNNDVSSTIYRDYITSASTIIKHTMDTYREAGNFKVSKTANRALALEKYPKYLKYSHDITTRNYDTLIKDVDNSSSFSDEITNELNTLVDTFLTEKEQRKLLSNITADDDTYVMVAPTRGSDLVIEGQQLSHCVGSYVDRVASGNTRILFLRHSKEPSKPYVTVEVNRYNQISQAYGFSDSTVPSNVARVLLRWAEKTGLSAKFSY